MSRREHKKKGAKKQDTISPVKRGTQSKPYHITYFNDNPNGKNECSDGALGKTNEYEPTQPSPYLYETTQDAAYGIGTNNLSPNYHNPEHSFPPKAEATATKGYEIPINSSTDGYITPNSAEQETVKDFVYQYENSSKSSEQTEEYPDCDDDSFSSDASDDDANPGFYPQSG